MNNQELLRILDTIHREKGIDKEVLFTDLETALATAFKKQFGGTDEVYVHIDRTSGAVAAARNGVPMDFKTLGRIAAQTTKQVMIQRIREGERQSVFQEFKNKEGEIINGTVARVEGGVLAVNLGRAEGFLPRSEQIPGETHHPGERIRCLVLEVREGGHQVKIVLTRTHPDFIKRLFELEVPEVAERIIEIKALAREAGYRTKIAVASNDAKVDPVGACVGIRGSRIKNIVEELGGEKIDIVRWNDSSQILIANALRPAEITEIRLNFEFQRATVIVNEDQLSLAIGKRGQNVRLADRLTGWDIDILTPTEFNDGVQRMVSFLQGVAIAGVAGDSPAVRVIGAPTKMDLPAAGMSGMSAQAADGLLRAMLGGAQLPGMPGVVAGGGAAGSAAAASPDAATGTTPATSEPGTTPTQTADGTAPAPTAPGVDASAAGTGEAGAAPAPTDGVAADAAPTGDAAPATPTTPMIGVSEETIAKIHAMGMISVADLAAADPQAFVDELQMDPGLAATIQKLAGEEAAKIDEEKAAAAAAARAAVAETKPRDPISAAAAAIGAGAREVAAEKAQALSEEERIRALLRGEIVPSPAGDPQPSQPVQPAMAGGPVS